MTESEKAKKEKKKSKTHDNRLKNRNMVNESQVPIIELKNTELKKNQVQKALTDSSSFNTSWADDTEAFYRKVQKIQARSKKESSNLENTSLNTNNNSNKAAETTKESRESRKTNREGEKAETQSLIETIQNNPTENQEMIEAGSSNERHKPYKKDEGGGGRSTPKENIANYSGHLFTIYTQKSRNNQLMATRLDYIFVDNDHIQFCQNTQTLFGNSDHLLVKSTFNMQSQAQYALYWKLNTKYLMNENIKKGIEEKLQGHITIDTWDVLKNRIQAKIRQYKPCPFPEKKVTRLHKRIAELQEEVVRYSEREELKVIIEQLQGDLQEELTRDNTEEWPWDKSCLTLANTSKENCTIKGTVSFLKEVTLQNIKNKSQIIDESIKSSWKWLKSKGLKHVNSKETGKCSNCPNIEQIPEHFAYECLISQKVWKLALELATSSAKLRIPEHWNDLFSDHYTAKWDNPILSLVIDLVIKYRLEKMVKMIKCIGKRSVNSVKEIIKDLRYK
ncbi:7797_t:CDS:2, partial [Gigaspora margarita]